MTDLVVTVPRWFWRDWIEEGDAAGSPETGEEWDFGFRSWSRPEINPGERLYIVAWDRLRGYAPVVRVAGERGDWRIVRRGGAVAMTIPETIPGFRGWRAPWWHRSAEVLFPDWQTANVGVARARPKRPTRQLALFGDGQ